MASQALLIRIQGDPSAFQTAMVKVRSEVERTGTSVQVVSGKLEAFGSKLSGIGNALTIGLTAPVLALGAGAVKAAVDMEALKMGLTAVDGGAANASRSMERLREVAKLPGLGFKEAVQGYTNLRAAGLSAELAEKSLRGFGNALATVGKGKAELDGVITALSQIQSKGKVSAEEINQLAERVPQIRQIMKDAFGTADTEVLQKAGIKSEEFIKRIVASLEKLPPVASSTKNAFENFSDAVQQSAVRIGEKFLPAVNAVIPKVEAMVLKAGDAVDAFGRMPKPIQDAALALGAFALAAGPMAKIAASIIEVSSALGGAAGAAKLFGSAAAVAGAGLLLLNQAKAVAEDFGILIRLTQSARDGFKSILKPVGDVILSFTGDLVPIIKKAWDHFDGLRVSLFGISPIFSAVREVVSALADKLARLTGTTIEKIKADIEHEKLQRSVTEAWVEQKNAVKGASGANDENRKNLTALTDEQKRHLKHIQELRKEYQELMNTTLESSVRKAAEKAMIEDWNKTVEKATEIVRHYGTTSVEQARLTAQAWGSMIATLRQLPDAPDMGWWKTDMPKPSMPTFEGNFEEFKRMGRNIGELGMQTKEQYDVMVRSARQAGAESSKAMRQISTVVTDLSRSMARSIIQWKGFGSAVTGVWGSIKEAMVRAAIETQLTNLSKHVLKLAGDFGGLGKVINSVFGTDFGKLGPTPPFVPGRIPRTTKPADDLGGVAGGGGASSTAGAAASSVTGIISAVTGVISAVSDVISNFQLAKIEKTLNAIEKSTRYTQIYTGEQSDSLLHTSHASLKYVQMIAANTKGMVGINIQGAITGDQTNDLINRLVDGSNSFWLDTYRVLKNIEEITRSGFAGVIGPLNRMANPSLLSRLLGGGGGGFGPLGGGVGGGVLSGIGVIGAAATGGIGSIVGGLLPNRQEGSLNAIEANTRKATIYIGEQSQSLLWCAQKTTEYVGYAVTALDAIGRFNSEMLGNLQQMNQRGLAGAGAGGTQISFTNCTFGAGMTQTSAEAIFRQAIGDLKRKGINP